MKKFRLSIIVYIISIIVLSFPIIIRESKADVVPIDFAGTGNFLPEEDVPLIMTNASVIFNIDAHYYYNRFDVTFKGNYTIYNPFASTNLTLAAPFSSEFKDLESSCLIRIDNNSIPYRVVEYTWENFSGTPWDLYVSWHFREPRKFVIINVTFPENDSITIEYSFDAYIENPANDGYFQIFYDVGTSRAWNGSITERVEFEVYGKHPDSYSSYRKNLFEYNCTITDIEDGISYLWEWENEIINVDTVYISYSYFNPWNRLWPFIVFPILF
ncbi:MAG: hypothetical protein ACFFDN_39745, partial [Candidatus Hodarchaeota archaeon]